MQLTIECQKRAEGSKPRALRREGLIPATLYGHDGANSAAITVEEKEAYTLLKNASVNNTLVEVKIPDIDWNGKALIREVQAHPWKKTLYHLSFFSIAAQDSVEVVVPVNLVGEAVGIKSGGIVDQPVTELKIQCAPDVIPESIDVDVSSLDIGANLHIGDLPVPEGSTVMDDADRIAVTIIAPTVAAEESESGEEELLTTVEE